MFKSPWNTYVRVRVGDHCSRGWRGAWTSCGLLSAGWSIQPCAGWILCWKPDSPDPASRELIHPTSAPILPCPLPGVCSSPPPSGGPALEGWRAGMAEGMEQALRCLVSPEEGEEGRALCSLVQKAHSWALLF